MDFCCFAFRFCCVSIFHIKIAFSSIQISEGRNLPQMNTPGYAVGKPAAIFMPKKGGRYGPTNHKAAGKRHPLLGTKAVCQLPERKLPAAGWIGGTHLCTAFVQ